MTVENSNNETLDKLTAKVKPFLRRYLEERNVTIDDNGFFSCINPRHKDKTPSCHFVPNTDEQIFSCFGCGAKGTIHHAAHLIEGKPMSGMDFYNDNLAYLADKYGIPIVAVEFSPEELLTRRIYKAYEDASDIVSQDQPLEYIMQRNWAASICKELGIGCVNSYKEFLYKMEARGYEPSFCDEIDLNSVLFNEGMLIFSIRDEKGRTVGFSSRDMSHAQGNKRPKFINTSAKCPIYSKSAILYGLDIGKQYQPPLYIFEGYPDYVTAYKYGIKNVCAIGGTALTREHISLIKSLGITRIILALDGDEAGQNRTETLLDEYFGGDETLDVSILNFPDGGDPDDFLSKHGSQAIEEFKSLPQMTPFQWRLSRFSYDDRPEVICDTMIKLIIGHKNLIYRETMCKELSDKTGIRLETIIKQVEKEVNKDEAERDGAVQTKIRQLVNDLKYYKGEPAALLESTAEELRQLSSESREDINSSIEVVSSMDIIRKSFEERKEGLQGWETGYALLDKYMSGIPKEDAMITFAGDANVGKCLKHDTNIVLSDGSITTIEDVFNKKIENILTLSNGKIIKSKVSNWIDSGDLNCFRVSTKSGRSIEVSSTHPFLTIDGWKNISDISHGEHIAVPKKYGTMDLGNNVKKIEAIFLGLLCGDGGITKDVRFTNVEKDVVSLFKSVSRNMFHGISISLDGDITYRLADRGRKNNRAKDYLESIGLFGHKSIDKFVPNNILTSNNAIVSAFLGAIYACDGWFCSRKGGAEIGICLSNYRMTCEIRSLLLRFGISSILKSGNVKLNGKLFKRFSLSILDKHNIIKFNKSIKILSKKKQSSLATYCRSISKKYNSRYSYNEYLPSHLWGYIKEACKKRNITLSALLGHVSKHIVYFDNSRGKNRIKKYNTRFKNNINPDMLRRIATYLDDKHLLSLCDGDILFDEIVEIKDIGYHQCYDLTVPVTHNFIANDIVVHNTGYMFELALRLAKNNPDIMVLFMSIDDSRQQAISRLVALEAGLRINQVSHPAQNTKTAEDRDKLNVGWQRIRSLVESGRFSIKDNSHGNTLDFAESWIRWAKKTSRDKEVCFFLDNFHKLGDERGGDERLRFKHASSRIHALKNKLRFTAICTMELRKIVGGTAATRPSLQDISESKQMEYDNNLIGMVYSDLHARRQDSKIYWQDRVEGETVNKPVIEIDFQKNKVSDFKGTLYYKFSPEHSKFTETAGEEMQEWQRELTEAIRHVKDKRHPEAGHNPFSS